MEAVVADGLERAVAGVGLHTAAPRWWKAAGALQSLLAALVAVGAVWLLVLAVLGYLRVDDVLPVPELRGVPIPTWLLVGGTLGGIALALLARLVHGMAARRRARAAARSLSLRVEKVAQEVVVAPVEAELDAYARLCAAVAAARDSGRARRPLRLRR